MWELRCFVSNFEFQMIVTLAEKYDDDIFYLSPFYHEVFPSLSKLTVVDVDVEFNCDVTEVQEVFEWFTGDEVAAVGNDLAPHYFQMLSG